MDTPVTADRNEVSSTAGLSSESVEMPYLDQCGSRGREEPWGGFRVGEGRRRRRRVGEGKGFNSRVLGLENWVNSRRNTPSTTAAIMGCYTYDVREIVSVP